MKFQCASFMMIVLMTCSVVIHPAFSQTFTQYFSDKTLRVDCYHTGTKGAESLALDRVLVEGTWPGSMKNLIDTLNLGEYQVRVYDKATSSLIFSRGYSTMFNEWQTTDEALAGITRTFHETIRMPFPHRIIQMTISKRDKKMDFHELFSTIIDPMSPTEVNQEKRTPPFKMVPLMESGDPHEKVDIVILGDGYRREDLEKFRKDAKHFNDVMFSNSPFKERRKDFNVWTVEVISEESGIDKPDKKIWKNSALGTRYNTFGSARYILTEENRAFRDAAAAAPYDFVTILINDNRYGGGGIYNLYTTTYTVGDTKGQEWQMEYVYVHEFGHCFGGLGDEYYSSQISYNEFYPKGVEPWEPNLTALLEKDNLKWKSFITSGTSIPTPWDKAAYDSLERERGKLDRLAPDYYAKREPLLKAENAILTGSPFAGKVGAFEGAGYVSEGIYRPAIDCKMFTITLGPFDPVCTAAIERVINFFSK